MAKKVILKDDNVEIMPITRGELVLDSSGQLAFHSSQFLATQSLPGLMSGEDKTKLDSLEKVTVEDKKVEQVNTTTNNSYRILFSNSADDTTKTEGARKSAKLLFNPSTGALTATALIGKLDWSNLNDVPENFTPAQHIHNTSEITALTSYSKASSASDLVTTDTLNVALGKLEYKADTAYTFYKSITGTDNDEIINKWEEIVDFVDRVKEGSDIIDEFVTRKTGQTITGVKTFSTLLKFTVDLGTSPFTVTSTTKVDNLNADLLDGKHATDFMQYSSGGKYVQANLINSELWSLAGGNGYIEYYDSGTWFNSQWGKVTAHYGFEGSLSGNATSATKLQTARTIWGQLFDGSSDVTGDLLLGAYRILGKDAADIVNAGSNHLVLGYGSSAKGWPTYVDGDSIYLRYGTSHSDGIFLNSSGNVGIGTTSPIHKLQVAGAGVFNNTGSTTYASNGITIGAGDVAERYITCYGKTGTSYINFGYNNATNNCGELAFNYVSNGSTSNYARLSLYGGANIVDVYPNYTYFGKPIHIIGELYSGNYGINLYNSDIIGINALYTSDSAESGTEGLQFSRGNGYYDSIWAASGVLYFSPNGNLNRTGSYSNNYTVLHTGNYTSVLDSRYDRLKTGTAEPTGTAVGWYRCAQISYSNAGYSQNVIISLQRSYNSPQNEHYIFAISIGFNGQVNISLISGCVGGLRISLVRVVYNNSGACYFDYYMLTSNYNNTYKVQILAGDCISYQNPTLVSSSGGTEVTFATVTGIKTNYYMYAAHFYENSDIMLKTNIKPISDSNNIPILKSFDWKSDGSHGYGLIAQELEAMGYPELVSGEEDGTKTVNYSAALSLIVGKMQVKIKELEKEIEILKKKN